MTSDKWTARRCAAWVVGFWVVVLAYPIHIAFGREMGPDWFRRFCDRLGAVMYGERP